MNPNQNNLSSLPPPPKGQTGLTFEALKGLPPPPAGQKGMSLEEINKKPNYFQRVGSEFSRNAQDVMSGAQQGAKAYTEGVNKGTFGGTLQATGGLLRSGLRSAGAVANAAFAPIIEAPGVKQVAGFVAGKAMKIPGAVGAVDKATRLAEKYPTAAKDVQNVFDIATLGGGKAVEKPLAAEGRAIVKDIGSATKSLLTPGEEAINNNIKSLFQKAIKPTGKKTLGQSEKYEKDIVSALRTIKNNSNALNIKDETGELVAGRAPQSINELAQSVDQTKEAVFKNYNNIAKQAGDKGAFIQAEPIAKELDVVASNKALQITNPELVNYAQNWADRLRKVGNFDPETTQAVIKNMNQSLDAFYRNPTYESATKVSIDAGIVNNFRKSLDEAIEGATGEQYQVLKKQYGALKAIENDVIRAANRDARKNIKGLLDYTDIFTGGQMLGGILSLNPAMFTKGAVERGIKEYIKFLNDPNRAIKSIFEKLDSPATQSFNPQSATGKFVRSYSENPEFGMSIKDITRNIPKDDLGTMSDYVDMVDGAYRPSAEEAQRLTLDAFRLAERYGKTKLKTNYALANYLEQIVEKSGFKTKPMFLKSSNGKFSGSTSGNPSKVSPKKL